MHFIPSVLVVGLSLLAACSAQADPPSDAIQRTIPAQEGCTDANGVDYSVGDKWQPTACTFCTCTDKLAVECASQNCPVLECPDGQVGGQLPRMRVVASCCCAVSHAAKTLSVLRKKGQSVHITDTKQLAQYLEPFVLASKIS